MLSLSQLAHSLTCQFQTHLLAEHFTCKAHQVIEVMAQAKFHVSSQKWRQSKLSAERQLIFLLCQKLCEVNLVFQIYILDCSHPQQ